MKINKKSLRFYLYITFGVFSYLVVLISSYATDKTIGVNDCEKSSSSNRKYIKAVLSNVSSNEPDESNKKKKGDKDWISYEDDDWRALTFDKFAGDESLRTSDKSSIIIPVDGIYAVIATYHWGVNRKTGYTEGAMIDPATAISINTLENISNCFRTHYIPDAPRSYTQGTLNYTDRFSKGDKIMLSIRGYKHASYYKTNFYLEVKNLL